MDYQRSQVRAGVVRSGIAAAASSSTTRRVSASSSHTPSARSIDFASERSPLQKLELELKHISQGDINPAGVARSLSRRQPQPQHPLTPATSSNNNTTSASPTSPARKSYYNSVLGPVTPSPEPSLVSPAESLAPPTKSLPDRQASLRSPHDASSSRHRHRRYENPPSPMAQSMPRLFGWRGSPEDALSNSQTAPNTMQPDTAAPANSTMHQTMHHLFGGKEHHFEDTNAAAEPPKPESSKFFFKVAHLSLENRLPYYNDSDLGQHGRKDFHQVNEANQMPASSPSDPPLFKDSESDNPNFLRNTLRGFPGGFDGPADQEANPSKVQDGHHLHHVHDPENPSSHHHPDHLLVPHTKEEREEALIMAYLRAVPSRPVQDPKEFVPPISIKCGPLLRYTGLRRGDPSAVGIRTAAQEGKETWRGSIMIVTTDNSSRYAPPPTVRIFYVNPDGNDHDRDLREKAKIGKFKEVQAMNLHAEFGITFWRFNLEVEMADGESKIAYRINGGPPIYFWVPAKGQVMNMMFHSCNGFSLSVNPDDFSGPDPLWNDVLEKHKVKPFHVMLGGGDQVYNDAVSKDTTLFRDWLSIKTPFLKSSAEFTAEMAAELEDFYLERYSMWFSQGMFGVANAQIPMVNIWDDHDIIDGFGSYPNHFNRCPVFTGLGAIAFKYYMLFQHQSTVEEDERHEPSWLLGAAPGPYITELSRSCLMFLGRSVALLGLDCRTERMRDLVVSDGTYDKVFARLKKEVVPGETKHLIVLLGVPIAYPRLVWLENLLTSRLMDPIKALSRMGIMGGFVNSFDGGVELLDDLDDHWTAKNHKAERNELVKRLQRFAADTSIRISILGGDVHLAGIGQFMSNPKLKLSKVHDHRYMPNIISSAIVNTPPPNTMADILNKRNKIHHLDADTDEDMFPIFETDVDGSPRNNKRLLPRRNYCTISPHDPESEGAELETATAQKSRFAKIRQNTFGKSSDKAAKPVAGDNFAREGGLDGAGSSKVMTDPIEMMRDGLQVTIRVEIDQKNKQGVTKPYRFAVPALVYDPGDGALRDMHGLKA